MSGKDAWGSHRDLFALSQERVKEHRDYISDRTDESRVIAVMSHIARVGFVLLWLASLFIVGTLASAQTRRDNTTVISGADIGFRPEGWKGSARTGTWVVRINGEWIEAVSTMKPVPATTR
jgi:hypothetical protein